MKLASQRHLLVEGAKLSRKYTIAVLSLAAVFHVEAAPASELSSLEGQEQPPPPNPALSFPDQPNEPKKPLAWKARAYLDKKTSTKPAGTIAERILGAPVDQALIALSRASSRLGYRLKRLKEAGCEVLVAAYTSDNAGTSGEADMILRLTCASVGQTQVRVIGDSKDPLARTRLIDLLNTTQTIALSQGLR